MCPQEQINVHLPQQRHMPTSVKAPTPATLSPVPPCFRETGQNARQLSAKYRSKSLQTPAQRRCRSVSPARSFSPSAARATSPASLVVRTSSPSYGRQAGELSYRETLPRVSSDSALQCLSWNGRLPEIVINDDEEILLRHCCAGNTENDFEVGMYNRRNIEGNSNDTSPSHSLSGTAMSHFYRIWDRKDRCRVLGRGKLDLPNGLLRQSAYRQCGCKTRHQSWVCMMNLSLFELCTLAHLFVRAHTCLFVYKNKLWYWIISFNMLLCPTY